MNVITEGGPLPGVAQFKVETDEEGTTLVIRIRLLKKNPLDFDAAKLGAKIKLLEAEEIWEELGIHKILSGGSKK